MRGVLWKPATAFHLPSFRPPQDLRKVGNSGIQNSNHSIELGVQLQNSRIHIMIHTNTLHTNVQILWASKKNDSCGS
jgi:hypothetical protein